MIKPFASLNRWQATGLHLVCSAFAGLLVLLVVTQWWIPAPFFTALGTGQLILIIVAVDVVMGPLLTLVVFNPKKPELRRDLTVIALLQGCAFAYGLFAATQARPVFLTFAVDRLEIVTRAEADPEELKLAPQALQDLPWGNPRLAWARQPDDPKEREILMLSATQSGIDLKHLFRYYQPFEQSRPLLLERGRSLEQLRQFNPSEVVDLLLKKYSNNAEVVYLPLQGKKQDLVALINTKTMVLIDVLELQPWQ